ncbi:MAG: Nif3-like dinuclear metal center hexameric protein [Oscillospiraceae bacterium]|nr:Nif3-like dinuclear metal center hexameric protein [Oscillospiraceae bacterium]
MATVAEILNFLNTIAPPYMREEWDNVGLNCGRMDRHVDKLLIALDPFAEVCREAVEWGAQLLVTHHILIQKPGFLTDQDEQGRNVLLLLENGIAHINAHTNLDLAPGGVNDVLASTLGLEDVKVLNPTGTSEDGKPYGLLRAGTVQEQSLDAFLASVKEKLGCPVLRYTDGGKAVHRVAVGGGSCGSGLYEAAEAGCDTFVTADIKYNQFWDARNLGLNIIDAGHFYTENPVCTYLAEKIRKAFPDISVKISQKHRDCMKFF